MGFTWIDISLITLLISLAAVLTAQSVMYLNRRDAQEVLRNRQSTCKPHEWVRRDSSELVCRLCGKVPG